MYTDLSWTWPIISPPEDYAVEASGFTEAIEGNSTLQAKTVLDLGCGGGHNDFHLKKNYDVTGVDISEGMLANARKLNPEARYRQGDMRTARLDTKFDAVIIADSIMYMQTEGDMLAAFRTAFEHLKPGGVFCTYAEEHPEKFSPTTTTHEPRKTGKTEITLIEHMWDPDPADTTFQLLFIYIIKEKGKVRVETDRHKCGLFPLKTWKHLLKQVGFNVKIGKSRDPSVRCFFICRKPL